jgi:hypothetical protein
MILRNMQAPGDVLMMTAAVRDLHRCYPGQFITDVQTTAMEVWQNNPYVQKTNKKQASKISLGYPLIQQSNQSGLHFIQGFIDDINRKLNLRIRLTEFRPDLHFSKEEMNNPLIEGPYWVILSGGKADFTTKWWDPARYQKVVDMLDGQVAFVQIGNKPDGGGARHFHPALNNVVNLVGKTNLRQAIVLIRHARGVLTPVTFAMHVAAGVGKPCVVIAGGREHWTWEAYTKETLRRNLAFARGWLPKPPGKPKEWERWSPHEDPSFVDHPFVPHSFRHTIGLLDCCRTFGCWRTKVTEGRPEQNCKDVVRRPGRPMLPRCLDMIEPDKVVEDILNYEEMVERGAPMPTVKDLIIKLPGAESPPPVQSPSPVTDQPAKKDKKKKKQAIVPGNNGQPLRLDQLQFRHLSFPVTLCSVTYGNHGDLAMRCLESIYRFVDVNLFQLRYGMNDVPGPVEKRILKFLEDQPADLQVSHDASDVLRSGQASGDSVDHVAG